MPLVTLDNASLGAVPGKRWQVVLYVNNNSAGTLVPMIDCRFTNAGKPVEETRVLVPAVGAGVRAGIAIYGPQDRPVRRSRRLPRRLALIAYRPCTE